MAAPTVVRAHLSGALHAHGGLRRAHAAWPTGRSRSAQTGRQAACQAKKKRDENEGQQPPGSQ
eukprot:scaffold9659_cov42-Prasinocladus_malaysianus.AAC.1